MRFPFLADAPEWEKFAKEYDQPQCVANREKTQAKHETSNADKRISTILERCRHIEHQCFWGIPNEKERAWSGFFFDGYEECGSDDERLARFVKLAASLAQDMATLLSNTQEGKTLRLLVEAEISRQQNPYRSFQNIPGGHQAHLALLGFIERESRLPTKSELNIEVTRMREPVVGRTVEATSRPYGQRFPNADRFARVRNCQKVLEIPQLEGPEKPLSERFEIEWVDDQNWKEPTWTKETFRKEILKPLGYSGLATANKDQ